MDKPANKTLSSRCLGAVLIMIFSLRCRPIRGRDRSHRVQRRACRSGLDRDLLLRCRPFRGRDRSYRVQRRACRSGLDRDPLLRCRPFRGRDRSYRVQRRACRSGLDRDLYYDAAPFAVETAPTGFSAALVGAVLTAIFSLRCRPHSRSRPLPRVRPSPCRSAFGSGGVR